MTLTTNQGKIFKKELKLGARNLQATNDRSKNIGADDSEGEWPARVYPRKKTNVSENKTKRENENKAKGIK